MSGSQRREGSEQILVFELQAGMFGAVINTEIEAKADNMGDRYRTQLVLARTQEELNGRCLSALVSEYGLTQEEANALVPGGMIPLVPAATRSGEPPATQDSDEANRKEDF